MLHSPPMKLWLALLLTACGGSAKPAPVSNQSSAPPPPSDDERVRDAELRAAEAMKAAHEAEAQLDKLQRDLADLDQRVDAAIQMVVAAQSDADRNAAKQQLERLRAEKAEMDARVQDARTHAAKAQRQRGVKIEQRCIDNPLAKGC